jgi:hypothetical protein
LRPPDGSDWRHESYRRDEAEESKPSGLAVGLLVLLATAVLCVIGFLVVRVLFPMPPASLPSSVAGTVRLPADRLGQQGTMAPGQPGMIQVEIKPHQGYINTLVTVTGQGWWPGEPVFVFLRSSQDGDGPGFAYAAAVADAQGKIHTAFTFPNEMRWIGETWAEVTARGTRSGLEGTVRFSLVAPTPTSTAPPPTARPTLLPTETAWPTETLTPAPTPTPDMIISDWRGEYFANPSLAGDPVYVRNDVSIDFNWGGGSPDPRLPDDHFSARWSRKRVFTEGSYRFTLRADDGVRFWIDGRLFVDEWHESGAVPYVFYVDIPSGEHSLLLEYYESLGGAMIHLTWTQSVPPTATPSPTVIPTDTPLPTDTATAIPTATMLPTDTPSATPTPTETPSPTVTPTEAPTATPTPTETGVASPTPTGTPTPTETLTPTDTPSPTPGSSSAWSAAPSSGTPEPLKIRHNDAQAQWRPSGTGSDPVLHPVKGMI